jgi:hypothetical protein
VKQLSLLALAALLIAGCASTSTPETRRAERTAAYAALSPEIRALVDKGQIKVGMTMDAVYIAWGEPAEILHSESGAGAVTTWLYQGGWMQETRYWAYRQVGSEGGLCLERYLINDYQPRTYIRAQLTFGDGVLKQWNTQPRPPQ